MNKKQCPRCGKRFVKLKNHKVCKPTGGGIWVGPKYLIASPMKRGNPKYDMKMTLGGPDGPKNPFAHNVRRRKGVNPKYDKTKGYGLTPHQKILKDAVAKELWANKKTLKKFASMAFM